MPIEGIEMNLDEQVAQTTIRTEVTGVELADCLEDGGKWVIYCTHFTSDGNAASSLLQDSNKRRLAEWKKHTIDWCCYCQAERDMKEGK